MKEIVVAYWKGSQYDDIEMCHNMVYDYSEEKRTEIINYVLNKGYNVMTHQSEHIFIIWIDKQRFRQS